MSIKIYHFCPERVITTIKMDEYCINLPEEAVFTEEGLLWNKRRIGNFCPIVYNKVEVICDDNIETSVKLQIHFTDGSQSGVHMVSLEELDDIDWFAFDQKCLINPDFRGAITYLTHIIRTALPTAQVEKQYLINRFGTHVIEGVPVFYTGNHIIMASSSENNLDIVATPLSYKMDFDTERYSERHSIIGMTKVLSLAPDAGMVLHAHILSGFMRSMFIDTRIKPCAVLEVTGPTGFKKTTYTSFLTQIYDREGDIKPLTRLNASVPAIADLLYKYEDCTVVLDDMHPADSRKIERQNEETFEEIVRIVGDDTGRGRMFGRKFTDKQPRCNVITTGEYPFGKGSTAARCLVIPFLKNIDSQKLFECQQEPLLVSTFYYYFIVWYIENYFDIKDSLAELLADFRKVNLGVHPRLAATQLCLFSAYLLFLRYCTEKGVLTTETARAERQAFWDLLTKIVKAQDKRTLPNTMEKENKPGNVDYYELIRMWYKEDSFDLAKNADRLKNHDGIIHKELLCLRSEKLLQKIQKVVSTATLNDVRRTLIAKGALKQDGEGKGIQIGKKRFYAIPLEKLR